MTITDMIIIICITSFFIVTIFSNPNVILLLLSVAFLAFIYLMKIHGDF